MPASARKKKGVIVVDSGPPRPDRIITLSTYDHVGDRKDGSKGQRLLFAFNGRAWPYTERYTYTVRGSIRCRFVHLRGGQHPLHLLGFYFRVERRGDGASDHAIPPAEQPLVVTEEIGTLGTFFFKERATPEIYTLSLHDALPI